MTSSKSRATLFSLAIINGFGLISAGCVPREQSQFNWDDIEYLIAFGDSYTFVQGTYGYPNFSFIGDYLPGDLAFTPEELLSDKIVQNFTGTAEGGPNWVEYLTGCAIEPGEHFPSDCDIQLWDFAYAGADISEEFLPVHHNETTPFVNQTAQFLTWGEPVLGPLIADKRAQVLVAVWIGINDINDSQTKKPENVTFEDFWQAEIDAVFEQSIQPLFDAGYRNFLFVNLPPLDRTAANQVRETPVPSKAQVDLWDGILANRTVEFSESHHAAKAMVYDANTFLNGVLDDPAPWGITNLTYCSAYMQLEVLTDPGKFGCLPLEEYFWYNSGHMASHTHEIMTQDLLGFLESQSDV
ncbi:hypothetical protein PFICI_10422 [Pestalotiopsis fici W106-1]|uniref:SGNH hydrolase-type esterase domain-containing protein n=1 Tax=Pestalotiopsis fici (strain W106-1 / CGMCC3.15140) TaxID=1229662 RepID=W3WWY6_PESFW|nr:uncharacterized protein PFICI_10422 [Pestalotiopsis fici W106-1]ETS78360.1 hypothetical protein PFICI_10422 [Pestalotiopsis fici W106-1]